MAILCPWCGRQYDATLFQFGQTVVCECGGTVAPFSPDAVAAIKRGGPEHEGFNELRPPPVSAAAGKGAAGSEADAAGDLTEDTVVDLPVDGVLDLHTFHPSDVKDLVPEYLTACRAKGSLRVRIVHGKGTGELLRSVHALLERIFEVESFELAEPEEGGWGATIVHLKP